ncbi:MAG: tRNA (adenosine(37)-N6)-threonylcarbamoyltransferase complex ATPase subunit type 1 TsaE, partial [Victivallales bacterium]|nr:tRNA (adenosine(37)-N6)-threonylcarbamoyltransferase complex ATPase subunit type 1 TsaE [Victivallales bacterium]
FEFVSDFDILISVLFLKKDAMTRFVSNSEEETAEFAAKIAANSHAGDVYALNGDLGAGKTVFSRGFARALGVDCPICSPTFTIVQEYEVRDNRVANLERLYHLDVYRIPDANSALAFGVDEFIDDEAAIKLIEWPERVKEILPPTTITIEIKHLNENSREIIVT